MVWGTVACSSPRTVPQRAYQPRARCRVIERKAPSDAPLRARRHRIDARNPFIYKPVDNAKHCGKTRGCVHPQSARAVSEGRQACPVSVAKPITAGQRKIHGRHSSGPWTKRSNHDGRLACLQLRRPPGGSQGRRLRCPALESNFLQAAPLPLLRRSDWPRATASGK